MEYEIKKGDLKSFFYAIDKGLNFKGSCKTEEDLPTQNVQVGDAYYIESENTCAIWLETIDKSSARWTKPDIRLYDEIEGLNKVTDLYSLMDYWLG